MPSFAIHIELVSYKTRGSHPVVVDGWSSYDVDNEDVPSDLAIAKVARELRRVSQPRQ